MIRREFFRKAIAGAVGLVVPVVVPAKSINQRWDVVGKAMKIMEDDVRKKHRIFYAKYGFSPSGPFNMVTGLQEFDMSKMKVYLNQDT